MPKQGLWEETSGQGCRVGKPIPVAEDFLSPKIRSSFERKTEKMGVSSHILSGTGLLSDNFYFRASLLQFASSLSWQRATYFEIFCNTSEALEV